MVIWLDILIVTTEIYCTTYDSHLGAELGISKVKYPINIVIKISCHTYLTWLSLKKKTKKKKC